MAFLRTSTDLTVYRINDPAAVTADKLKRHAFRPIDDLTTEEIAVGWTNIDDMLDTAWALSVPEKGEWLCFTFRRDKRSIPGAALKKLYAEALKNEKESIPEQKVISRKRKAELKEQVKLRMLSNIEPSPALVDVALNMHSGLLLVSCSAKGLLASFEELMTNTFGVELQQPEASADVQAILRGLYNESLQIAHNDFTYQLSEAGHITLAGTNDDGDVQIVVKNDRASADAGLASGLSITKLKLTIERDDALSWTFKLNSSMSFSGLKSPAAEATGKDEAALLEKLYLIEQAVGVTWKVFGVN